MHATGEPLNPVTVEVYATVTLRADGEVTAWFPGVAEYRRRNDAGEWEAWVRYSPERGTTHRSWVGYNRVHWVSGGPRPRG